LATTISFLFHFPELEKIHFPVTTVAKPTKFHVALSNKKGDCNVKKVTKVILLAIVLMTGLSTTVMAGGNPVPICPDQNCAPR
jgi:hypothetical protein